MESNTYSAIFKRSLKEKAIEMKHLAAGVKVLSFKCVVILDKGSGAQSKHRVLKNNAGQI